MSDIGTTYKRQVPRGNDDAVSAAQEEARKEELSEHIQQGVQPVEAMEQFEDAWAHVTADAENIAETSNSAVQKAIVQTVQDSMARVNAALESKEQRMARAFVDEMERRGTILEGGGTYFDSSTEEAPDISDAQQEAEEAAFLATLDDEETGETDEHGNPIYRNPETGEEWAYVSD